MFKNLNKLEKYSKITYNVTMVKTMEEYAMKNSFFQKMIHTEKLVFEYDKRDEEGNVIGRARAIDEVDINIE